MRLGRLAYRARQFAQALTVRASSQEQAEVEGLLSPEGRALLHGMAAPVRRHGLAVYRRLRRLGVQDRELLTAALLHDVGKGRVTLSHRVAAVLLGAAWPGLLERLGRPGAPRWREGFYEHLHHEELGAELARGAGSSPVVVDLIRYHHQDGRQAPPGLAALRMADEGG